MDIQIAHWIKSASAELAHLDSARLDAELLLCHVLNADRSVIYAKPELPLSEVQIRTLDALLMRRVQREPIAYLLNTREFWSLDFHITPDVLVPRPETELLVEMAIDALASDSTGPVLDAGTGSGAIAVALAVQLRSSTDKIEIVASDKSVAALNVAKINALKHKASSIEFVQSDWLRAFDNNLFGIIISNPPYLASDDAHLINTEISHEPKDALVSGTSGFDAIEEIIVDSKRVGKPGCFVALEHGSTQGANVRTIMQSNGYSSIQTHQDLAGLGRTTSGFCPAN